MLTAVPTNDCFAALWLNMKKELMSELILTNNEPNNSLNNSLHLFSLEGNNRHSKTVAKNFQEYKDVV